MGPQSGGESPHGGAKREWSNRQFADEIGVNEKAVRKARQAGRLKDCLGKNAKGNIVIVDFEIAKREWTQSSRTGAGVRVQSADRGPHVGPQHAAQAPRLVHSTKSSVDQTANPADVDQVDAQGELDLEPAPTLIDAQTQANLERARKLRLENDVTEGRPVSVEEVSTQVFDVNRIVRESVLNISSRLSGELAAESDPGRLFRKLDAALREALSTAADNLQAAVSA